jgi:hypothetical protein
MEVHAQKSRRREKKVTDTKSNIHTPLMTLKNKRVTEIIQTTPWKPLFGHQTTLHASLKWLDINPRTDACNTSTTIFSNNIYIYSITKMPLIQLYSNKKKNQDKKMKKLI